MIHGRIFVLLMTALLTLPALSGNAQTPAARGIPAEDELAGIKAAVRRDYAPAGTFLGEGTIAIDDASPISSEAGMYPLPFVLVIVREFDTAEQAASAFEQISAEARASIAPAFPNGTREITSEQLPDIGSQATLVRMDYTEESSRVQLEYVIVQREQYVFFVNAHMSAVSMPGSDDIDVSLPTVAIATSIASNGEPSPDAPMLMEDGTSSGGLWGFMLPADDPLLKGLVPVHDTTLYPMPNA